jgi:hypothetical protein
MVIKAEKVLVEKINLKELLNKDFLDKLIKINGTKLFPINITFMNEKNIKGKPIFCSVVMGHESNEDVDKNIVHITSEDTELVEKISKILDKGN